MITKYTKSISLGVTLLAFATLGHGQEFVVAQSQMQMNSPPACQENCQQEVQGNTQGNSNQHGAQNNNQSSNQSNGQSGAQGSTNFDRSGMDKASVHLQVLQQAAPRFTESSSTKKPANDDKKSSTKTQDNP